MRQIEQRALQAYREHFLEEPLLLDALTSLANIPTTMVALCCRAHSTNASLWPSA